MTNSRTATTVEEAERRGFVLFLKKRAGAAVSAG